MNKLALVSSLLAVLSAAPSWAQTQTISTVAIGSEVTAGGTAQGVAAITPRIGTAGNVAALATLDPAPLTGVQYIAGNIPLTGAPAALALYTLTAAAIPAGGVPASAFTSFDTTTSPTTVTTYASQGVPADLTPNSYSGLTWAAADLGFGAGNFYTIHHTASGTDYFAEIVPGTATSTLIQDLKPMSWPATGGVAGGPGHTQTGAGGYLALSWGTGIGAFGAPYADQSMYYLRTGTFGQPSVTGTDTLFGVMIPALTSGSQDTLDLTTAVGSFGVGGYAALEFCPSALGNFPANQFYYLRQDTGPGGTGNTILGLLNPSLVAGSRTISDIANLGGVFTALTFAPDATGPAAGWSTNNFFVTGSLPAGAQSISFAAIPDHNIGDEFTITPTASSGLDITVSVLSGPATVVQSGLSGSTPLSTRIFTVTTTGSGIVTLQAKQAGQTLPTLYTANWLNQSFRVLGLPVITGASIPGTVGTAFSYTIVSSGSPTSYTASGLPAGLVLNASTGTITGTPTAIGTSSVLVGATNSTGTGSGALAITVTAAGVDPVITNSPLTAAATVGTPFLFAITGSNAPTSYSASPLPAGLTLNSSTGIISGTPTVTGPTAVLLGATNATGTGNATLAVTVTAAGVAPVITNSPLSAAGTVGTAFSFTIAASNSPTQYGASPLPAGLVLNSSTGVITGTPTVAETVSTLLTATNSSGTSSATLSIIVAAAGVAPIISNNPLTAPGTVGIPFGFTIAASGLPTTYSATGLPAGLSIVAATGAITGTPTAAGTAFVLLGASNATGTGNATLAITVAPAGVAPIISNNPLTAAGAAGTPFSFTIAATGLPTSYGASPLPAGLSIVAATGAITGTPTSVGTTSVLLTATNSTGTSSATLTITVAAAGVAPVISNNPLTAAGTVGTPFSFAITATGLPTSYAATGLPSGLSIVAATGAITGIPAGPGTATVTLTATNSTGTGSASLTLTVAAAGVAPTITNSPLAAAGIVGVPFSFVITASDLPTGYSASPLPAGLTIDAVTGEITGTPTTAGDTAVLLGATNAIGSGTAALALTIVAAAVPPGVTVQPVSQTVATGGTVTFTSGASGTPSPSYQWYLNGVLIPGATNASLTISHAQAADAGSYTVTITNDAGAVTTTAASLNVTFSRIVDFSARAQAGSGSQILTLGFVVSGNDKTLLVRGIGPDLLNFGVVNPLTNVILTLYSGNTVIASDDGWQTGGSAAGLPALEALTGAFPLPSGSLDSALSAVVNAGVYSVEVTGTNNATGTALAEVYDADSNLGARLINASARMQINPAGGNLNPLTIGFVISGNVGKTVLIRGIGPGLVPFGVTSALPDPQIVLFSGNTELASNNNWESNNIAAINSTFAQVGAFPLATGSLDAALVITLQPGTYTVQILSISNSSGIALLEVYDVR